MIDHAKNWWGAIAAAIDEAFIATDEHDQIVAFNLAALHLLHLSTEQVTDPGHWKSEELAPLLQLLHERKTVEAHEIRLFNRWLCVRVKRLTIDTQQGFLLLLTDVTNQHQNELALHTIIRSLDDLVLEVSADGTILHVWANQHTRLTLPWPQFVGKQLDGHMPEGLINTIKSDIRNVLATGTEKVTVYRDPLQKGHDIWYRARLLKHDENANSVIISIADITDEFRSNLELEDARSKLEESQQIFQRVFEYSPTGIGLINADLTWGNVNGSMESTLGYSAGELRNQPLLSIIHPEDQDNALRQLKMLTDGEIDNYRAERRYLHKNGQFIWVFLAVSHLVNADGSTRFFIIQMIDVTELKHLVTEANKKNIILHATSVDLQQKIRQLKEFNSIIAHNLRGPATALIGSTDLLPDVTDERDRQLLLHHMKRTSSSILETLNDLKVILDMQENIEIPFVNCDLPAAVAQMWSLLNPQVVEKDAVLLLDLRVTVLHYPKVYLESILRSLLSNALMYTRPDVRPEITVASWEEDEFTSVLMVADNGMGIDLDKHRTQLFGYKKKFHKGYNSNGISLFMIRNQIRTFGGNIEVVSEEGKGSSFYIYFNNRARTLKQDE
jgi:PAS domain S-box-containing protein